MRLLMLQYHPADAEILNIARARAFQMGRLDSAGVCWSQAVEKNPDSANAQTNMGLVHRSRKCLSEAEACFRRALAINSDHMAALFNLGDTLRIQRRLGEAEATYRQAIGVNHDNADAFAKWVFC
jgi:tetratricopeptide (TPR) repeat protein